MNAFRRQHPGLHGGVGSLDLDPVQETGPASDQHAAGKRELRQGLQPPLVYGTSPIANPFATLEVLADPGMLLPALKLVKR